MRKPTEREEKQYQRLQEIFALGRQRYLGAGGAPDLSGGSLNKQDYLTDAEKKELVEIGQQIFNRDLAKVKS
jgi:hypothetical protein